MSRHLLIDGDILVYQFAHSEQRVIRWRWDLFTQHAYLPPAVIKIEAWIEQMQEKLEADVVTVVLSDSTENYRKELNRDYKASRLGKTRPILYSPLRSYFYDEWGAKSEPRLEGDDLLGLLADQGIPEDEYVMCTIDKDLCTVPGLHYNWDKDDEVRVVDDDAAYRYFLLQTLTGDQTDGYKGCPGIGPVKANTVLDVDTTWEAVVQAYEGKGFGEDVALMNARCARILRGNEYNFETKELKLWTPPTDD